MLIQFFSEIFLVVIYPALSIAEDAQASFYVASAISCFVNPGTKTEW